MSGRTFYCPPMGKPWDAIFGLIIFILWGSIALTALIAVGVWGNIILFTIIGIWYALCKMGNDDE